jgi:hypothetical protein
VSFFGSDVTIAVSAEIDGRQLQVTTTVDPVLWGDPAFQKIVLDDMKYKVARELIESLDFNIRVAE